MNVHLPERKVALGALVLGLLGWIAAASLTGCAPAGGGGAPRVAPEDEEERPAPELTLHVKNQNFYDATLYAVSEGGAQRRLGVVRGLRDETIKFRWLHAELRIVINLIAAGAAYTESIPVTEGDELELIIRPDAHLRR
ncbi:MAG TPA: hypothetical protein VNL18_16500 [Gemmatimonadales bacterium]|nr:hypothetical protein [Gemmatimonadales bacterium]